MSMKSVRRRNLSLLAGLLLAGIAGASHAQSEAAQTTAKSGHMEKPRPASAATLVATPISSENNDADTRTPIKHVLIVIGENRTFDHVFATYTPAAGQTINNLLSEGIVNADGTPGPNVAKALQYQANQTGDYSLAPPHAAPYEHLPRPNTGDAPTQAWFSSTLVARMIEPALLPEDYAKLIAGGTGLPKKAVDTRFPAELPNAPIDLHAALGHEAYAGSPAHRFFQMWQQLDCDVKAATPGNPSGCRADLFPWVSTTMGGGNDGKPFPADYSDQTTHEGGTTMEFLNMAQGDAPYFKQLADQYTISDNFHQSVMGGTGANHIMLGFGTLAYYADADGKPAVPPANQIENPNAQPGTNNWWINDGYAGGSYVQCADVAQPGVAAVNDYLRSLPYQPANRCKPGAYYLVNNYNPGFLGSGELAPLGSDQYTMPPSRQPNLATLLAKHGVSWKDYGEGWNHGKEDGEHATYCNICDPFLYSAQVMTNPALRKNNQDVGDLYDDIKRGALPAVAIVKSDEILDGHPASSKLELFEAFVRKLVTTLQADPKLWDDTAVFVTFDEGGGYYDSGYVQPLDFFGDGTRIPLIVVSKYSTGGRVVHAYADHVSIDKFVEANWKLGETIAADTRDTLPNPQTGADNPYVPTNAPALDDLMGLFDFGADAVASRH